MAPSISLNLTALVEIFFRRSFTSAGLSLKSIEIDNQTKMCYWSPESDCGKPPLVLIHGFGTSSIWQWHRQISELSIYFHLLVPDLIFFGLSTTASPERSDIFQAVTIGKLLEKIGIMRFSVVGTSYGGFVAYHLARELSERIDKVVIASSDLNKNVEDDLRLKETAKITDVSELLLPTSPLQLRTLLQLLVFKRSLPIPNFLLNHLIHHLFMPNRKEKLELLQGVTLGNGNKHTISPLQQEVLIIWGEHDQIFRLEKAYDLKKLLGEKVRLEVIKQTGHSPQLENPCSFNAVLLDFLMKQK